MKQFFFISVAIAFFFNTQAQNSFLIYSVKGTVTIAENNQSFKAQIGKLFSENAKLTVGANSLVSIICNEKSLFSIVKAGSYNMQQFKDSCVSNKSSITSSYLKFIWGQLTKEKGSPEKNRKNYMNNVGAVSRSNISIWVDSRLDTINYYSGAFPISWKCYSDVTEFSFELFDAGKSVLQKTINENTTINIQEFVGTLKTNTPYTWTLHAKDEENTEKRVLIKWDKPSYEKLLAKFREAKDGFETEAEENFRIGFLLESARFYADAYQHYKIAAALNPAVELYSKTLEAFRKDYNIKE